MTEIEIIHQQIEILHRKNTGLEECLNILKKMLELQSKRIEELEKTNK